MFYDSILFGNAETNIFNNPPTVNSVTIQNTSFDNPLSVSPTIALNPKRPRSLMDRDDDLKMLRDDPRFAELVAHAKNRAPSSPKTD